jgi:hypothetical protein
MLKKVGIERLALLVIVFAVGAPLITYTLMWLKGIFTFEDSAWKIALAWTYQVTLFPSLVSGTAIWGLLRAITQRTAYFHRPYDFGRCFSLGAVTGAVLHSAGVCLSFLIIHPHGRPSAFWIATGLMAGALCGSATVSLILWLYSRKSIAKS